jgi:hypothetical protein
LLLLDIIDNDRQARQPIKVADEENEDEDIASSLIDDDAIEAQLNKQQKEVDKDDLEEDIIKYLSVWKAIVNGKENLSSRSAIYADRELYIYMIKLWQDEVIKKAQPQQLEVVKLEAVASYERCRAVDECPFDLQDQQDIRSVQEVLRMWHKQHKRVSLQVTLYLKEGIIEPQPQLDSSARAGGASGAGGAGRAGRRTATQRQLADLPTVLQSEQFGGNLMLQIADRWPCKNSQCRNKGKTCWQNKKQPDSPDYVSNHYSVPGELFRQWNCEINKELSTVEQPSQNLIVQLVNWRERDRKKTAELPKPIEGLSTID